MKQEDIIKLIDEHGTAVYRFCHKLAGNKPDADDLYQDTFLMALEKCHSIDEDGNPKALLLSMSVKLWKSRRRKYARRQRLAPAVPLTEAGDMAATDTVEEAAISLAMQQHVSDAVDELPDKLRMPLYLYYTLEMDIKAIGDVLGIPPGTVKSRLYKARESVKQILEANTYAKQEVFRANV